MPRPAMTSSCRNMSTSTRDPSVFYGAGVASASADVAATSAEHRQLTVMFADLVGSTALLEEHGPEAFSDLLRVYHNLCTEATRSQDGTVANYLGDGVISYFGYPRGTEDDPLCAVQAAWTILQSMAQLNRKLAGAPMAARIGIATGRVIIHQKPGDHYRRKCRRRLPQQGRAASGFRIGERCNRLRHHPQAGGQGVRLRKSRPAVAERLRAAGDGLPGKAPPAQRPEPV